MTKTNIYESNWVDMVFEEKNREYGAFILRKKNNHYTVLAIIFAILAFGLAISAPVIIDYIKGVLPQAEKEIVIKEATVLTEPPPVDEKEPPPLDVPPPPPLKQTLQYTAPVIKPDEEVEVEAELRLDSIKDQNLSTQTQAGVDEPIDLTDLEDDGGGVVDDGAGDAILDYAEQMPVFPGGDGELQKFIVKNTIYPAFAIENKKTGTVKVSFVVQKDGRVTDAKVISKELGDGLEEEALRVVRSFPKFTPGAQNGNPAKVKMVVPIRFKLQ